MILFPENLETPFEAWRVGMFLLTSVILAGWGLRSAYAAFLSVFTPSGKD